MRTLIPIITAMALLLASWTMARDTMHFSPGSVDGEVVTFTSTLTPEQAAQSQAICLTGVAVAEGWDISVNGVEQPRGLVTKGNLCWYQVGAADLVPGVNVITARANNIGELPTEASGFNLDGSFEEFHFAQFIQGFAGTESGAQPAEDANQPLWDAQHVQLDIELNTAAASITSGTMTLTATSLTNGLTQCVLDFNDNGGSMTVSAVDDGTGNALTYTHNGAQDRIFITLDSPVNSGNDFTVRVFYSGTPLSNQGFYRTTQNSVPLIYTESQAYRARNWWPCKDLPYDKFTIDLNVTCPDTSYGGYPLSVVCNGTLTGTTTGSGNKTFHWSESHPIATQYVVIYCTNYRVESGTYTALDTVTTMDVSHHIYPNSWATQSGRVGQTIEILEYLADNFGEYPFVDEKYANVVWGVGYGMEHQTCTGINNGSTGLGSDYTRRNIHETAHMWFGTSVGVENFDHLWISEGWATYAEALFYEYQSGSAAYHSYVNNWSTSDSVPIVSSSADSFTGSIVYRKGAWVLHMLRHVLGDTDFFQGSENYAQDPNLKTGTATSEELKNHYEAVSGRDLDWFFDQWLYRASRPSYEWSWATYQDSGDAIVQVAIEQVQVDSVYQMPIDIEIEFSGGATTTVVVSNEVRNDLHTINVGPGTVVDVRFDPDNWVLKTATEVSPSLPDPPTLKSVIGNAGAGEMTISWEPTVFAGLVGYRLYESADGQTGWSLVAGEGTLGTGATSRTVTGVSAFETKHFRLTAVAALESNPSDVYSARLAGAGNAPMLVVDGADRWDTQTAINPTEARHDFVADHGRAISAFGTPFNSCANEVVGVDVDLTSYEIVDWILADESTVDETFSDAEQDLVEAFLEGGGKLFVSGNEIGWDLGRGTRPVSDQNFYANYLKAVYVADDSNDYTVTDTGVASLFNVTSLNFGDGGDSPYLPGYPDLIATANGSDDSLQYSASNIAGVQYQGTFGSSSTPGALVHFGFAFETIYPEYSRIAVMDKVLTWFSAPVPVGLAILGSE